MFLLELLLVVILAAHLLAVDVAMAGPLACAGIEWRAARRADRAGDELARRLAVWSIWALAVGSLLGGLLLAMRYLVDEGNYWKALAAVPRDRIGFGIAELGFSFVCLGAYAGLWNRLRGHRVWHRLLALAGASNMLIHLPALFTIVSVLSRRGHLVEALDRAAYRRMLLEPEVMARVAHVWLAAAAVTGIVVTLLAIRMPEAALPAAQRQRYLRFGAWLGLGASVLQFPVGTWVLLEMPESARRGVLGGDWLATGVFWTAIVLAVWLVHQLWSIAVGEAPPQRARRTAAIASILVLLMVGIRLRAGGDVVHGTPDVAAAAIAQDLRNRTAPALASSGRCDSIGGTSSTLPRPLW